MRIGVGSRITALLSSMIALAGLSLDHKIPEKFPVVDDEGYKHGPSRKFHRRVNPRSWFAKRKRRNRIAKLSRRINRQRAA